MNTRTFLHLSLLVFSIVSLLSARFPDRAAGDLVLKKTLKGSIRPKSVVYSGNGMFFAQNMMYRHTITVYDREYRLVKTISDKVNLSKLGYAEYEGEVQGAPVEAAFSHEGLYAWVSQYHMDGPGFDNPGTDNCKISRNYDNGFVYKIDTETLEIVGAVEVGCIPKFLAVSPDERYLLVSNWCSGDLSVVDMEIMQEIKRIPLGRYPRGIAIDSRSRRAYVAIMGSDQLAEIDLQTLTLSQRYETGKRPRHLCLGPFDRYLYMSLNNEGKVAKMDLLTHEIVGSFATGSKPRSMTLSPLGGYLYVVNYAANTLSKVRTSDMTETESVETNAKPIGLTLDPITRQVWVACYSGSIMVFEDQALEEEGLPQIAYASLLPQPPTASATALPVYELPLAGSAPVSPALVSTNSSPADPSEEWEAAEDEFGSPAPEIAAADGLPDEFIAPPASKPAAASPGAKVSTESKTSPEQASASKPSGTVYTLIVGSFAGETNANKLIEQLGKKEMNASLHHADGRYRVKYGNFDNKEAAIAARAELIENKGMDAWVLRLQ